MQSKHGLWICAIVEVKNGPPDTIYMKKFLIIVAAVALFGWGCTQTTTPEDKPVTTPPETEAPEATQEVKTERNPDQPLKYSLGDVPAVTERSLHLVRNLYTAEQLVAQSEECGTNLELEHFTELLGQFKYQRVQRYNFLYRGGSQEPTNYTLTVLDNGPGYEDLAAFKQDFDVCAAGSIMQPLDLNENWLVFESSCGTGFDDGSGLPIGCEKIREQVTAGLEVN